MDIKLQSTKKLELVRRVIELEKRGWHCISPIKPYYTSCSFGYVKKRKVSEKEVSRWKDTEEIVIYKCKMRKEDKD